MNATTACTDCDDGESLCSTASGLTCASPEDCCSESSSETLVICDWDDTLFPTSSLQLLGLLYGDIALCEDHMEQIVRLTASVEKLLRIALQFGKVVIVTNAQKGWVEKCCRRVMPSLLPLFEQIEIVSARSTYERCATNPSEWKRLAFDHEVEILETSGAQQYDIVSLGDSIHEQQAIISLCDSRATCCGKSFKFMKTPTMEDLIIQHDLMSSSFSDILEYNGNLDITLCP